MKTRVAVTTLILTACVLAAAAMATGTEKYPYRADYPGVKTIETYDLFQGLEDGTILVVDVRSKLEFDVIHVDGAHHIPVAMKTFTQEVKDLAAANPGLKIAFYCNGTTCLKSYKAAAAAEEAGLTEVYAYDSGIPEWAGTWPQKTLLLGETIHDPDTQLLKKDFFKAKCLDFEEFRTLAASGDGVMVIDVRDHIQKSGELPGVDGVRSIPLDVFIPNFVAKQANMDRSLLIFDQVGKQIKWLQYYLEKYGYTDYHFLEGGATTVLKSQDYRS